MTQEFTGLYNFPNLYANGCSAQVISDNTINVSPGAVRDHTNSIDIILLNDLLINSSVNGALGLDTGVIQQNKVYYVYLLSDPTGAVPPTAMISLSPTAPVLPTLNGFTYSFWRIVDFVCTGVLPDFIPARTSGNGNVRYKSFVSQQEIMNSGSSTSLVNIPLGSLVPLNTLKVQFFSVFFSGGQNNIAYFYNFGDVVDNFSLIANSNSYSTGQFWLNPNLNSGVPTIQYKLSASGAADLNMIGIEFLI